MAVAAQANDPETGARDRYSGPLPRSVRLGAFATVVLVFMLFGAVLRVWFLLRGGSNHPFTLQPVFLWCVFLGLFRDGLLAALASSPLLLGVLPSRTSYWWRGLLGVVLVVQMALLLAMLADVEFMRFYHVHINAYVLSYLQELGPLSGSMASLLSPWEWAVGFGLIPLGFVFTQVRILRSRPVLRVDLRRWTTYALALVVGVGAVIGMYNYKMTRWFTRELLAYQVSENGLVYLWATLQNPKYTAPPVPDEVRFAEARDIVRAALGSQPQDSESEQPWYWLSNDYAWARGTGHHVCQLGLGGELGLRCDADLDGDGFTLVNDCDDTRASVNPGAADIPGNRDDEDCDGIDAARPNVILVLLESHRGVNTGVFRDYGALPEGATPTLDAWADRGQMFYNFYANGVTTARAVLATLAGVHPHIGAMLLRDYNNLNLPSLGEILGEFGYRRTYMHSGDTRFDNKRRWLEMWFDEIHDMTNTFASAGQLTSWGVPDSVMFDYALEWADVQSDGGHPFFLTAFTVANHHPFHVPDTFDSPYPPDSEDTYLRFLNTMAYQGAAMGDFLEAAQDHAWWENTYVLVVSDTGQVMGERDVYNDLGGLPPYEASMWVPFFVLGPGVVPDASLGRQVGSQVDFAPTVLDLLGITRPHAFAGRTLMAPVPYDMTSALLSNPYRDVWVAYRRGDLKTIHGRESGTTTQYNLARDRGEEHDLVAGAGYDVTEEVRLLDAWVDFQEYMVFHNLLWDAEVFSLPAGP